MFSLPILARGVRNLAHDDNEHRQHVGHALLGHLDNRNFGCVERRLEGLGPLPRRHSTQQGVVRGALRGEYGGHSRDFLSVLLLEAHGRRKEELLGSSPARQVAGVWA